MLRKTQAVLKRGQDKVRETKQKGFIASSRKSGGPSRRRSYAVSTNTCPFLAPRQVHHPLGQPILKKGDVNTLQTRRIPEEQEYADLQWENEEDTPNLLHPNSQLLEGYGKKGGDYWDGYHIQSGQFAGEEPKRPVRVCRYNARDMGKVIYPQVPKVDARMLSNAEFATQAWQERARLYLQKHHLFSLFPSAACDINMNVNYANDDSKRRYWQSAYRGNVIELNKVLSKPRIILPNDGVEDGALYTLVMLTPDHPFRAEPERGHALHWVVANLKAEGGRIDTVEQGQEVLPYLMPLPSEDAGLLRYVFALYKQTAKVEGAATLSESEADLDSRRRYFLHDAAEPTNAVQKAMKPVEAKIGTDPCALNFFHTSFDYEVMDYYQKHDLPEPMYTPTDIVDNLKHFTYEDPADNYERTTPYGGAEKLNVGVTYKRSVYNTM